MATRKLALLAALLSWGCAKHVIEIDVGVIIPAEVPTIASGELQLSLWEYNPLIADVSATLVGRQTGRFAHRQGERDEFRMQVGGSVSERYYITINGYETTGSGENRVLWGRIEGVGVPQIVTMVYVGRQ